MKTIIKVLLIYIGLQFVATALVMVPVLLLNNWDIQKAMSTATIGGGLLAFLLMSWYLYAKDYFRKDVHTWSVISWPVLGGCTLLGLSSFAFLSELNEMFDLPNILENQFVDLSNSVGGVIMIVFIGPVLEELLFRGAILGTLLKKMKPWYAILLSALIFGIIHFNPAQIIYALLFGLILGRVYYVTGSLTLCILMHVIANGISTFLTVSYPEMDSVTELLGAHSMLWISFIFVLCVYTLGRMKVIPDWEEVEPIRIDSGETGISEEIKE